MKIGPYSLKIVEWKNGFSTEFIFAGLHLWYGKHHPTKKEALDWAIKILGEQFQECLDDLKPKYQTKSKVVDAYQWQSEQIHGITVTPGGCDYYMQPIKPGDWIIGGKVVTNEEFQRDYEAIQ